MLSRLLLVALIVTAGCSLYVESSPGTDDAAVAPTDATVWPDPPCDCNPVVGQSCCDDGEKCAPGHLGDDLLDPLSMCVLNGDVPTGGACTVSPNVINTAYDDCVVGDVCADGFCRRICSLAPSGCEEEFACVLFANLFQYYEGIGACVPSCDVFAQDCERNPDHEFGTGCYVSLTTGSMTCAPAIPEDPNAAPGVQGQDCMYLNTCAAGYGCTQLDDPVNTTGNVCAFFCDADAAGGPTCADGPGAQLECVAINGGFYNNAPNVPMNIGFCVDCTVWTEVPGCM